MDTAEFWEDFYAGRTRWSGRPNELLVAEVEAEPAGDALDLGCGEGGDAIWLAQRGWRVTAVDVSTHALAAGAEHERRAGIDNAIRWERHDLDETFPAGSFDLVVSCYLQSPVALGRVAILCAAAAAVRPGGLLVVVGHAGPGHDGHAVAMPSAAEVLVDLDLGDDWDVERCADVERPTRPDSVVRVRRATE